MAFSRAATLTSTVTARLKAVPSRPAPLTAEIELSLFMLRNSPSVFADLPEPRDTAIARR